MHHSINTLIRLSVALLLCAASAAPGLGQTASFIEQFSIDTRSYAAMHRRVEQRLGPLVVTASPGDLVRKVAAIGDAIRAERATARQGDLFSPDLADLVRARLADAMRQHNLVAADLATDEVPEGFDRRDI